MPFDVRCLTRAIGVLPGAQRGSLDDLNALGERRGHGVGEMLGSMLVAVFMAPGLDGAGYAAGMDMAHQLVARAVGVSAVGTAIAALMVSLVLQMRLDEDAEREGLDLASHGERVWELD